MITPADTWSHWLDSGHRELKDAAVPSLFEDGVDPRLMVVTGINGGGKSLVVEILRRVSDDLAKAEDRKLEVMDIGMKRRISAGIERSFIFGHETTESTGNVSIRTALRGIQNSRERDHEHWLVLDEPDIGVGEGYHHALGEYLADHARALPASCSGFVVVSHSRVVVEGLLAAGASSLRVGSDLRPVSEWIANGDLKRSVGDLIALQTEVKDTRSKVNALLDTLREERKVAEGLSPSPMRF